MEYRNGFILFAINKAGGLSRVSRDVFSSTGEALAFKTEPGCYVPIPCFVLDEPNGADVTDEYITDDEVLGSSIRSLQDQRAMQYFNAVVAGSMLVQDIPEPLKGFIVQHIQVAGSISGLSKEGRLLVEQFDRWINLFLTWLKSEDGQKHFTEDNGAGKADTEG